MTQLALACTGLALLPLLVDRRRAALNPALFVFLSVAWGVLAKALYITVFRGRPQAIVHDRIYVGAASPDFFEAGALLALAAVAAYVAGYFTTGRWTVRMPAAGSTSISIPAYTRGAILVVAALAVLAFGAYLFASGTNLLEAPLSAKRFGLRATNVPSRFQYLPYYFFKLAMLSGPLAYVTAYLLVRSETERDRRFLKTAFAAVFVFALLLAHFASLRLAILLIALQIALLLYYFAARHLVRFMGLFALLAAASFAFITFVYRAPREPEVVRAEALAARAADAAGDESNEPAVPGSGERPYPPGSGGGRVVPGSGGRPYPPGSGGGRVVPEAGGRPVERAGSASPSGTPADGRDSVASAGEAASPSSSVSRALARLSGASLEGRYFLDVTKLAHIAHHFPAQRPHLAGGSLIGAVVPSFALDEEGDGDARLTLDRYLGARVFDEPGNSVPAGFAGELYIDFGWAGVLVGFFLLGGFHRLLFNQLTRVRMPGLLVACAVVLIPNTTLILINSGIVPAMSRSVIGGGLLILVCLPAVAGRRFWTRATAGKERGAAG